MDTTMTVNQIETAEACPELSWTAPDFDTEGGDSVLEAFQFLGAAGFGRDGARSIVIDMIELS
jgi:hypothetical protein